MLPRSRQGRRSPSTTRRSGCWQGVFPLRSWLAICMLTASVAGPVGVEARSATGIQVIPDEAHRRVDIAIDGKPFTAYIWPTTLKKPVLYPLRTANGTIITRGFPLEQRPGERIDHPHHAGLWFNYEDVNGLDFWNNSEAIKPE